MMTARRIVISLILACVTASFAAAADVAQQLQEVSVTIGSGTSQGSGVVFNRDGYTWVWTAAHVVDSQRRTRKVIDPATGTDRTVVYFYDAKVIKHLIEHGRTIGKIELNAQVVRYSDKDAGQDLALLKLRKADYVKESVAFYLDDSLPSIGARLWHVGSLLGEQGSNSLTSGVMSQHGRLYQGKVYDQTTVTAFPGSSGGGVYLEDGRYIGMLVRGAGEGFNLIVPIRRMREWAEQADVLWAIDPSVPMPSEEELDKLPVEDIGVTFRTMEASTGAVKEQPTLHDRQHAIPVRTQR